MIEAHVEDIAVAGDGREQQFLVLLRTKNDDILPIFIGPLEARAIAVGRAGESLPRPMTHDLMLSTLEILGASVKRIEVTDLLDATFYAKLIIESRGLEYELDARPSDALALAVRLDMPIFIAEKVIELAALSDDFTGGTGGVEA